MKISVIIPTYNRADLIAETINSVLQQTFQDFEIIVVDDGSSDQTPEVLASFGDRIRYIRQQNGGVNNARNHALSIASGDYIATLDDDDLWLPHKLALQVQIMDQFPELAYTYSNFGIYKNPDNIQLNGIQSWYPQPVDWQQFFERSLALSELNGGLNELVADNCRVYFGSIYHASLAHYYVLPSTALFRRSMIPRGVGFVEHDSICGDWDFFARLSRDNPVAFVDHETAYNRSHEDEVRLTRTAWKKQLECRIDMLERLYLEDETFYARHEQEVDAVYASRLFALCRQQLLDGERRQARLTLGKCRGHASTTGPAYLALLASCSIPGSSLLLRILRHLRG